MNDSAPAGWYPDGHGNDRYWDGSAWTDNLRAAQAGSATSSESPADSGGMFAKAKRVAVQTQARMREEKAERRRQWELAVEAAGPMVTSGVFGTSSVEIYKGGYVRVAEGMKGSSLVAEISDKAPFEKLRSIKLARPAHEQAAGGSAVLETLAGPVLTNVIKGGAGLMKASVPGIAVAGVAHLAGAEGRRSYLTIATDKAIYTLTNESGSTVLKKTHKGHVEVGVALEEAGNAVLGLHSASLAAEPEPQQLTAPDASPGTVPVKSVLSERLRELATLHGEGILSDDEFAAAKGKLLEGL